jgi:hypothetical protein
MGICEDEDVDYEGEGRYIYVCAAATSKAGLAIQLPSICRALVLPRLLPQEEVTVALPTGA